MIKNHNISVPKTARYAMIGEPGPAIKHVWIICHGYGHLAHYFIKKFEPISNEETLLIAPEGLHRFYLNGVSGRIGASWMTKEDRLSDIEDYTNYLNTIYESLILPISPQLLTVKCVGFSQGGATISRWLDKTNFRIDNMILWASVFPPDLELNEGNNAFKQKHRQQQQEDG